MRSHRRVRAAYLTALLAVVAVFGIVSSSKPECPDKCQTLAAGAVGHFAPPTPPSPTEPAAITVTPGAGAEDFKPDGRVEVTATSGTLQSVTMVNDAGKEIPGVLTPDTRSWKPTVALGYGRTYTMTIAARGPGGMPPGRPRVFPPWTRATRRPCI